MDGINIPVTGALYIHVPFCAGICDYCDFYSIPVKPDDPVLDRYIERILQDARLLFSKYTVKNVPSVFIGGGTPSLLGPQKIKRLLEGVLALVPGQPLEVTVEANPESAGRDFLAAAREAGANRLSLGVQSFHEASRMAVRRGGDYGSRRQSLRQLSSSLEAAAAFFPGAFSVDLMSGLPFQNKDVLLNDIESCITYKPSHISLYALHTVEGTPFFDSIKKGHCGLPDKNEADDLWICGRDHLETQGFAQYEVSNFCRPGQECLHNLRYWRMESWLALGPAGSATLIDEGEGRGLRYTLCPDVWKWLDRGADDEAPKTVENLDTLTLIKESLLMGFRLNSGPDTGVFKRRFKKHGYGSIAGAIPRTLSSWQGRGLCVIRNHAPGQELISLTKEGMLFLDSFLRDAFDELS